jgi:hypothetical protein
LEETVKFFTVVRQHPRKPDSIPDGSVTGYYLSDGQQGRVANLKGDINLRADLQSKHHLDIETAKTQVGSFTANRRFGRLG